MKIFLNGMFIFCTKKLGDNDGCAGRNAGKKAHNQLSDLGVGTADTGKCIRAHKMAHDQGVHSIIKLLKKSTEYNRKKEEQKLFPDHTFGDLIGFFFCCRHF